MLEQKQVVKHFHFNPKSSSLHIIVFLSGLSEFFQQYTKNVNPSQQRGQFKTVPIFVEISGPQAFW